MLQTSTLQIVEGIVFSEILTITNMLISVSIACAVIFVLSHVYVDSVTLRLSYFFQLITNFIFIITCASRKLLYLPKHFLHILGNLFLSLPFTILLMSTSAHICSSSFSSSIVHRSNTSFPAGPSRALLLPGLDSSSPHPKHCSTWAILAQYFIYLVAKSCCSVPASVVQCGAYCV